MDGNILDPDGARERLGAWKDRIDKLAADTQAMSDRLHEVRVTATHPTGLAEVTIDSTGALVDLRLTDRIQRTAPAVVAQTILATLGEARNKLADRSQEIIADTVGTQSPAARAIADSVGRQLRGGPAPEPTAAPDDDDEGYDTRSYLGRP
ncbi:MAG: YbaB/EbfC family nucleoid-associated protein [Actinomycetota bacterium]|nr:YbaB/EbfC family nucleoid-associated protein [Actinomycetota bacterium]